jgi:hypothetical protein
MAAYCHAMKNKISQAEEPAGASLQCQTTPANCSLVGRMWLNHTERNMITNLWKRTKATFTQLNPTARVLTPLLLTLAIPYQLDAAGPAPVDLGSAAHFTILAGAAITTTGGGIINGDVGASPITGAAIALTQAQVNGTIYAVDAAGPAGSVINAALLLTAKGDLTKAINDAAGRTPIPSGPFLNPGLIPGSGNIGGMNLAPGLYKFTGTALITGADVTLTGGPDDVWIFQIAADLEVGSTVQVILAGGAQARNIFWQVDSATIGTFAVFKGTIMSDQAITMNTTSAMDGRALAFTAGVTFNGNVGELPTPTAPIFARISRTTTNSVVVLNTTPYFLVTLQSSPDLSLPNWTTIATNTPVTSPWTLTDDSATATVTQCFYRAFITTPN